MTPDADPQAAAARRIGRDLMRDLLTARGLEELLVQHHKHYHPSIGEEAVIVGSLHGLRPDDYFTSHYRGAQPAALLRGADPARVIAGVLGKVTGYDRGRFRTELRPPAELSMMGIMGGSLGPSICYGTGAALTSKVRGNDSVSVVLFGDGTANKGEFHEAVNMAASMSLPVVYVCQNNQYSVTLKSSTGTAGRIHQRAAGYGIPGMEVDGNDVLAVHEAVAIAVARARRSEGPSLIEALTFRVGGHWASDPASYVPEAERTRWKQRDPIALHAALAMEKSWMAAVELSDWKAEVEATMAAALKVAEAAPLPTAAEVEADLLYATPVQKNAA